MANFLLKVHSAVLYGLMEGGSEINQERCLHYIELGKRFGIVPDEDFIMWELFEKQSGVKRSVTA